MAEIVGAKIILESLYAPVKQIAENAGYNGAVVLDKILSHEEDYGFNAATSKYEHLVKAGIVDPTKVTRTALQNAVSIASMLLITEAVVADLPEKKEKGAAGMPGGMMGEEY
jgi:chaperonin GroEL